MPVSAPDSGRVQRRKEIPKAQDGDKHRTRTGRNTKIQEYTGNTDREVEDEFQRRSEKLCK